MTGGLVTGGVVTGGVVTGGVVTGGVVTETAGGAEDACVQVVWFQVYQVLLLASWP